MGNKIITEQDFWICPGGLMPAPMQSGQQIAHKKTNVKYITRKDTATVSYMDFGCRKLMLIMAILAAVIAVATVATGGAALIAIGALAGAAGAAFGAVVGGLICGQLAAMARQWMGVKTDFLILDQPTITSGSNMKCLLFGQTITPAPHIQSWWQALAVGGANLISGVLEGMLAGAAIGLGGAGVGGIKSLLGAGGKEAAKQVALGFLKSAPRSVMHNLSQGISGDWVMKGIDASQQWLTAYGESGEGSLEDFAGYLRDSSFSEVNALKNIATGQGGTADWLAAGMLLMPGSAPNKSNKPNHAMGIVDEVSPKTSNHAKDIPDDLPNKPRPQTSKKPKVKKKPDGGAFEDVQLSTKGQLITLTNVTNIEFTYIKRNQADTIALRNKFNSSERKNFLKFLAKDKELLKAKGFSDADIRRMEDGLNPKGYQVHHKYPLDDSGTNDFDNLVLIKNDPYHKAITAYQNTVTNGMSPGDSRIIDWYIMNGNIYP